jgi:hypothetical protein
MEATISETDEERATRLEQEQAVLDAESAQAPGDEPAIEGAPPAPGEAEAAYEKQLAAAREQEGLDAKTALPTAADDAGDSANIVVEGDIDQLAFRGFEKSVGGKKPTGSKVRLTGGAFEVKGGLTKGATYIFEVKARVGGVSFDDQVDAKTGQAVDCDRGHKARILAAVRVEKGTIDRLEELQAAVRGFLAGDVPEAEVAALVGVGLAGE